MINEYGSLNKLSIELKHAISIFKNLNSDFDGEINIYEEYPYEQIENENRFLKVLVVSKKGIIYIMESNDDKKIYRKAINSICMEIDSIADKIEDGIRVCESKSIDDFETYLLKNQDDVLTQKELDIFDSKFQKSYSLLQQDNRDVKKDNSLGSLIKKRNNEINKYDTTQFNSIYNPDINTHLRIRGLAGCGKTIILLKRMAYLHYINPQLKMCYVFFTISLKQYMQELFAKFYSEFNPSKDYDSDKIKFYHSWGSVKHVGFYSRICNEYGIEKEELYAENGTKNSFSDVCNNLINKLPDGKLGLFDYVFVDEAQDFPLAFYKLVLKSLYSEGKMIYAYDELQSLYTSSLMPTKTAIFNDEECEDINLGICYRTPKEILVTAHALGMGIYSENHKGLCNIPEDVTIWKAIGYDSQNEIKYGEKVSLFRNPTKLDGIIPEPIEFVIFDNKEEQYSTLSKSIYGLIKNEDITTEDLLIIDLDGIGMENNYYEFKRNNTSYLNRKTVDGERLFNLNIVNKDNAIRFRINGSIPYTTIFRAKGNEANIVFIINADKMSTLSTLNRNRLFTAMTRAKMKVYIYGGKEIEHYINEFDIVKNNNYKLDFIYPTATELRTLKTMAAKEEKEIRNIERVVELTKNIKDNPQLMIEVLLAQTGCKTVEDLQELIKNGQIKK